MEFKMNVTAKGIALSVLFIVMAAGLIFLGLKAYEPKDCTAEMQAAYIGGSNEGLTLLIQQIEKDGVAIIGMPNNESYPVTNLNYCQALIEAAEVE